MSRTKLLVLFFLVSLMTIPIGQVLAQQASNPTGTAIISDFAARGDRVTVSITNMPLLAEGQVYEGWLTTFEGTPSVSIGVMEVDRNGMVNHIFISESGVNLIGLFNRFVISIEPGLNDDPAISNDRPYVDEIPLAVMTHIRHLVSGGPDDSSLGILDSLRTQLDLAILHAQLARGASDITTLRVQIQHVINILEGRSGDNYDSNLGQLGDGVGAITHAQGREHAGYAASVTSDITVLAHAALVGQHGENAEIWATQARDEAIKLLTVNDLPVVQVLTQQVLGPLEKARNGTASTGRSAAEGSYLEAQRMATYTIPVRAPIIPTPVPTATPVPEPTATPVPEPPVVGEPVIPNLAHVALIASLVMLMGGGYLIVRARREKKGI